MLAGAEAEHPLPLGSGDQALLGGRYRVGEVLGAGATAEVHAGWDVRLDRPVAVKLARPGASGRDGLCRLAAEARSAARISHPHVVSVFDAVEPPPGTGQPFIVMEKVTGPTLKAVLDRGPLPVAEVRVLAVQMLSALAAGVRAGVLHCDVKPGNILQAGPGRWKLADFGIARCATGDPDETVESTAASLVTGTPAYLSPERLCGGDPSEASDVFALGVVLYEALTGERPYATTDSFPWSTALSGVPAAPVRSVRRDADPALAAVVDRAIRLDPRRRYARVEDMAAALGAAPARRRRLARFSRPAARPPRPAVSAGRLLGGGVAAAAAVAVVLGAGLGPGHPDQGGPATSSAHVISPAPAAVAVPQSGAPVPAGVAIPADVAAPPSTTPAPAAAPKAEPAKPAVHAHGPSHRPAAAAHQPGKSARRGITPG